MLEEDSAKEEMNSQFILRLPSEEAKQVKDYLRNKPKKIKKYVKIYLDPETRESQITLRKKVIPMKLVDLPTIIESLKTINGSVFFKTADICQMLVPSEPDENCNEKKSSKKVDRMNCWEHGLTPPLKNVRKQRFRRVLKNDQSLDSEEVEKELKWLLKSDSEAVAVRWELLNDSDYKKDDKTDAYYQEERDVFGDILTDTSDTCTDD